MIADGKTCAEASLPRLADRAMAEPLWVTTALNVWTGQTGQTAPESILGNTPQCEAALKSVRPYLESRGACADVRQVGPAGPRDR